MGNSNSNSNSNHSNNYSRNTAQVYNVAPQYTDHQTINFSRNDLIGTISALSISPLSTSELVGGGIPRRDRYSQYESSVKPSKQSGGGSGVTTFSSVSSTDLNDIKNMIIGGGGDGQCGCETQMCGGGSESSYNPLNSMSSQSFMHGGSDKCGTTSFQSLTAFSATSPMAGGSVNSATSPMSSFNNNVMLSATSPMAGGSVNSATSPMAGGSVNSATSPMSSFNNNVMFSATSPMAGGNITNYNVPNITSDSFQLTGLSSSEQAGGSIYSPTSDLSQLQGGALSSSTSSIPIKYSDIMGGAKKGKSGKKDNKKSSSSSGSSEAGQHEPKDDMEASSSTSSSTVTEEGGSSEELARALADTDNSTKRELQRISDKSKSKRSSSSCNSATTSSTMSSSTSSNSVTSNTSCRSSSSSHGIVTKGFNNYVLSSSAVSVSDNNLVNVKQFYSSDHGDLYSSESNFLRNNISKSRLR